MDCLFVSGSIRYCFYTAIFETILTEIPGLYRFLSVVGYHTILFFVQDILLQLARECLLQLLSLCIFGYVINNI